MSRFVFLFLCLSSFAFPSTAHLLDNPKLLSYAQTKLSHEGILHLEKGGFLYISVPKEFIFDLVPLLSEKEVCPPPYFGKRGFGAHITVATADEMKGIKKSEIPFLGKKLSFSILQLETVSLEKSPIGSVVYFLTVDCKEIGEIRKALGLSPRIKDYDFHITIAVDCPRK